MSSHRYPGGVISTTPPAASSAAATGVWTLEEALRNKAAGNWPNGAGSDSSFKYNVLALHGDGTNGATNSTFLDGSPSAATVTRTGNTTQGSFSPYYGPGCWSDFYAATSSGWQTPAGSVTSILGSTFSSTATFTVEAWIYPLSRHSGGGAVLGYVFGSMNLAGSNADWTFGPDSNGNLVVFWYQGGNQICKSTNLIPLNTWTHIALVVTNGAIKMYINGVQETTTGTSTINLSAPALTYVASGGYLYAGTTWQGFNGYISNLRVVGKRAVYSANFTPSTTPLAATTDTTLLVNNSASLVDQSASNWTLTATGGVQISKFSPFSLYQTTPASYSGYFDGTGDYLTVSSTANAAFGFGTADFTVEAWVYYTGTNASATKPIIDFRGAVATAPSIFGYTSNQLALYYNGSVVYQPASLTLTSNAWNHVALVRSSGVTKFYLNGTGAATTYTDTNNYPSAACIVGSDAPAGGSSYWLGSLSNVRVVKGTAVYTSNFTPPTSPLTAISGTSLLTCQSTTFIDNSTNAFTITANGNATPKKANPFTDSMVGPTPYSPAVYGGSAYFDGSGDYLSVTNNAGFASLNGVDYTVEFWVNLATASGNQALCGCTLYASSNGFAIWSLAGVLTVFLNAASAITGPTLTANQWYHIALVRRTSSTYLYVNGALQGTPSATSIANTTSPLVIGGITSGTGWNSDAYTTGYISNFRLIKGTALYTRPFVPPAAPLTAVGDTQLLLGMTNAGVYDTAGVVDVETTGTTQIDTATVKFGSGSMKFDGTSTAGVTIPSHPALALGSGDWTIEAWVYYTTIGAGATNTLYSQVSGTVTAAPVIYLSGGVLLYYTAGAAKITGNTMSTGQWYHIAVCRASGNTRMFVNGTQVGTTYADSSTYLASAAYIGNNYAGTTPLTGYVDDLRISRAARYTATFTPPTNPYSNY